MLACAITELPSESNKPRLLEVSKHILQLPIVDVEHTALAHSAGLVGSVGVLTVKLRSGEKRSYITKHITDRARYNSRQSGLAREALAQNLIDTLVRHADGAFEVPACKYASGSMATGEKLLIMEDMRGCTVQSGHLFGAGSPLNAEVDLHAVRASAHDPNLLSVCLAMAKACAALHSQYWAPGLGALVQLSTAYPWLRGSDWVKGDGKAGWLSQQQYAATSWQTVQNQIADGSTKINWNSQLVTCMNAAIERSTWEDFQNETRRSSCTIIHGDFHPANCLWRTDPTAGQAKVVIIDWEQIGVGNGPREIAQALISHMPPAKRREFEPTILQCYYDTLYEKSATVRQAGFMLEQCKAEYVKGGVGRWMWMLAVLSGMCPPSTTQYFHDQLYAFMQDHNVTVENVGPLLL